MTIDTWKSEGCSPLRSVSLLPILTIDLAGHRFMLGSVTEIDARLTSETKELKSDITNLEKKLHYLETTHKNSREHIDQIFSRASGR